MGKRKKDSDATLILAIIFIGGPLFLIMTHPWLFFLLVVPIAILLLLAFIGWLKK